MFAEIDDPQPFEYQNFSQKINDKGWTGSNGVLSSYDSEYAVVHESSDWSNKIASIPSWETQATGQTISLDDPQLGEPAMRVPANERVIVSVWDASDAGLLNYQDAVDSDLPGETTDTNVTVTQIGAGGSTLDTRTVDTVPFAGTGASFVAGKTHHAASLRLSPGVYQIRPESGGPPTYIIAGEQGASQIASGYYQDLEDKAEQQTERAKQIQDLIDESKMTPETVVTDSEGRFNMTTGSNVKDVAIIAYKKPEALDSVSVDSLRDVDTTRENITQADIKQLWDESTYNGSLYVPTSAQVVPVGDESKNVTVNVREVSSPTYGNLSRVEEAWEWFGKYLRNNSYDEAVTALQQRLDKVQGEELRQVYLEMYNMAKEGSNLEERANDKLPEGIDVDESCLPEEQSKITEETLAECIDSGDVTEDELRQKVGAMEETIQELENTIDAGDGTSEITNETLSATQQFGTALDPENLQVLVHFANGSSKAVPADSDYVNIEDNVLGGSTVSLSDYPVGESPVATAHFRVVTSDGTGEARNSATNPGYGGDIPSLDSVDYSSLNPGPDERVRVRVNPDKSAAFNEVESVTVYDASGTKLETNVTDDRTAAFTTDGAGVHHVRVTYSNPGGDNFTTSQSIVAAEEPRSMPAEIRVEQSAIGTYALTGESFAGGSVDVSGGGSSVAIAGRVPSDGDAPGSVHVHTHGLSLAPDSTTQVSILRGDSGKTVNRNVRVTMHTPSLPDGAIAYRKVDGNGEPLPQADGPVGNLRMQVTNATINTYTAENGRVSVRVITQPGFIQRITYQFDRFQQQLSLPSLPIPSIDVPVLTMPAPMPVAQVLTG